MAEALLRRWLFLVLVVAVAAVYLQAVGGTFVWDDRHLVLASPQITGTTPLRELFFQPFWVDPSSDTPRAYYRPLVILSFALDYRIHGENAAGYHLTNVVLHLANTALLAALMRKYRVSATSACLLALAWALAPRLTEAVAWISGRTDVLATTFVLSALLVHRPCDVRRGMTAALLLFLGLLSKEVAIAGVAAVTVSELTVTGLRPRTKLQHLLPLALAVGAYSLLRVNALQGIDTASHTPAPQLWERVPVSLEALGRYAMSIANPWTPQLQQGLVHAHAPLLIVLGGVVLVGAAIGFWVWCRRSTGDADTRALSRIAWTLGATSLGLVLHIVPLSVGVVSADRFLYLPLAALVLGLGHPLSRWLERSRAVALLAVGYVVSLAAACFVHVDVWNDELNLWSRAFRDTPAENGLPGTELGNVYYRAGLYLPARSLYQTALDGIDPNQNQALAAILHSNIAKASSQLGQYEEAGRKLQELCATSTIARDCLAAGRVELHQLHLPEARRLARLAESRSPQFEDARKVLAQIDVVERALQSPDLNAPNATTRAMAQFEVMSLAGRQPAALTIAETLLRDPAVQPRDKASAAEYWVRWAPPNRIQEGLSASSDPTIHSDALLVAAQYRITQASRLMEVWPSLGVPMR